MSIHRLSAAEARGTDRIPPIVVVLKIILYLLPYLLLIIDLVSQNKG